MLNLDPIKARVAGGWNVHPEEALLIAEVERLREAFDFSRWDLRHPVAYAAMCLYKGEISFGKFCEWVSAYGLTGEKQPIVEGVLSSGGVEETSKELKSEVERLRGIIENHEDCTERDCAAVAECRDVNDLPFCRVCYAGLLADSLDGEL